MYLYTIYSTNYVKNTYTILEVVIPIEQNGLFLLPLYNCAHVVTKLEEISMTNDLP